MSLFLDAPCSVSAATYARVAMTRWLSRQLWWLALLVAACCWAGVYDARWAVAGGVLFLLGMMMLMTIVYFNYVLSPHARWSVMEKETSINDQGICFKFVHPRMNDHMVLWNEVKSLDLGAECVIINLMNTNSFIMLPGLDPDSARELKRLFLKSLQ